MKSILEEFEDTMRYGDIISYANGEMIDDLQRHSYKCMQENEKCIVSSCTDYKESWRKRLAAGTYFWESQIDEIFNNAPKGFYKYLTENGYIETIELKDRGRLFIFNSKFVKLIN